MALVGKSNYYSHSYKGAGNFHSEKYSNNKGVNLLSKLDKDEL